MMMLCIINHSIKLVSIDMNEEGEGFDRENLFEKRVSLLRIIRKMIDESCTRTNSSDKVVQVGGL